MRYCSDGIELELADGRTVRPVIKPPDDDADRWHANAVADVDGYAIYGPEVDDNRVAVWFEEVGGEDDAA